MPSTAVQLVFHIPNQQIKMGDSEAHYSNDNKINWKQSPCKNQKTAHSDHLKRFRSVEECFLGGGSRRVGGLLTEDVLGVTISPLS